jgi:hypothetical protein
MILAFTKHVWGRTQLVGPFEDLQCEFKGTTQPRWGIFHSEHVQLFRFCMLLIIHV